MRPPNTRAKRAENQRILAASNICHICGEPGADAVDHVIPLARGGLDIASNKKPAHHNVEPKCNRVKGDKLPADINRRVVLICGPPGAGKTTYAHTLGLPVYDLDDDKWSGNDGLFRANIALLKQDAKARAAVIRTGATLSARQKAATMCGATEVIVIDTPLDVCVKRIRERGRVEPPIGYQISGARKWHQTYEPGAVRTSVVSLGLRRSASLSRPPHGL